MKFIITTIAFFSIITTSLAQHPCHSMSEINFGTSAKAKKSIKKENTYKIERIEEAEDFMLFVPLSFSPNGDGIDDHLQIETYNVIKFVFTLFDQYGSFLLHTNNPGFNWDGTINNHRLKSGLYIYTIQLTTLHGQIIKNSGTIMINS